MFVFSVVSLCRRPLCSALVIRHTAASVTPVLKVLDFLLGAGYELNEPPADIEYGGKFPLRIPEAEQVQHPLTLTRQQLRASVKERAVNLYFLCFVWHMVFFVTSYHNSLLQQPCQM